MRTILIMPPTAPSRHSTIASTRRTFTRFPGAPGFVPEKSTQTGKTSGGTGTAGFVSTRNPCIPARTVTAIPPILHTIQEPRDPTFRRMSPARTTARMRRTVTVVARPRRITRSGMLPLLDVHQGNCRQNEPAGYQRNQRGYSSSDTGPDRRDVGGQHRTHTEAMPEQVTTQAHPFRLWSSSRCRGLRRCARSGGHVSRPGRSGGSGQRSAGAAPPVRAAGGGGSRGPRGRKHRRRCRRSHAPT